MKKLLSIIISSCVFAGCAATEMERMSLESELGYTEDLAALYETDADWWKAYNDEGLNRLVELAIANNPDLIQSGINISRALNNARLAGLDLYPTLSGSLGVSRGRALYTEENWSKSFSGEMGLSYELDYLGKINMQADMQGLEYEATTLDYEMARLTLVNSVIDIYYNMAYLKSAYDITKSNLESYEQLYEIANARYEYGKTDAANRLQAEQSLISAQNSMLDIENQLKSMEQSLRNLLNLSPLDPLSIAYADIANVIPIVPNLDIPLAVLGARPDLQAAELRLSSAFKNTEIQNNGWYPSISLRAAVSSSTTETVGEVFDLPILSGGLSVSLPFLDWNRVKYNIKISELDYQSTLLSFETAINTALNEVSYYYYAYEITRNTLDNSLRKLLADQELVAYYRARYEAGSAEMADLLSAINTESSSRRDILNNTYQLIKYENMIYKAMGGRYSLRQVEESGEQE